MCCNVLLFTDIRSIETDHLEFKFLGGAIKGKDDRIIIAVSQKYTEVMGLLFLPIGSVDLTNA